ncbi:MAG: hypothetical protein ACFFE8_11770 [Candidatus Heimdallarchaeota archaeon]
MRKIKNDWYLRVSFLLGGSYNLLSGIILLLFWDALFSFFSVNKPEPIFVQITGLFLIVVGYFLIYAAQDPRELMIIGIGSVTTRLAYLVIVLVTLAVQNLDNLYLLMGIVDAAIAILILILLLLTDGVMWRRLWSY